MAGLFRAGLLNGQFRSYRLLMEAVELWQSLLILGDSLKLRRRTRRRLKAAAIATGLAGIAAVVAVTAGAALAPTPPPASPKAAEYLSAPPTFTPAPSVPLPAIEASVKTAGKLDGPLTMFDTGQDIVNFGGAPGAVVGGSWRHNVGAFKGPAAYAQVELPKDVTRIGAAVQFPAGAAKSGSVALVIPSASWESDEAWRSGVHFVVKGDGEWRISPYSGGKEGKPYDKGFAPTFLDGREVRFDILVNRAAGSATVILPDGSYHPVKSPLIKADSSRYAIFELYERDKTAAPAVITEMWASSK